MAELATQPNNISEVNRLKVFGVESLQVDLWGVLGAHGSSCERFVGSGWVLAGGEAHELARGCCGLGGRVARGSLHTCLGGSDAHLEHWQRATRAPGPCAWSDYRGATCALTVIKMTCSRARGGSIMLCA